MWLQVHVSYSSLLFLSFVSMQLYSFHIQSHGSLNKCYLYILLLSRPPWTGCLLFFFFLFPVYSLLLRLGRADIRLCLGANVFKSSKCFNVNSEFQYYSQSQLVGQWLRKGCTAKGWEPELKPKVRCDL